MPATLRRLSSAAVILWGVYTLTFVAVNLLPGDPFLDLEDPRVSREAIDQLRARWGYDRPLLERYFVQLRSMFWREAEALRYETGDVTFEVASDGVENALRAEWRAPPDREAPGQIELQAPGGGVLVLERSAAGRFGPRPAPAGAYRFRGEEVVVPAEPLGGSGLTFDLGVSIRHKAPVLSCIGEPLLNTLLLAGAALALDFAFGIVLGSVAAARRGTRLDGALALGSLFVYSMPAFWLGLMLVLLFSVKLQLLPSGGMSSPGVVWHGSPGGIADLLAHLVLPACVLGAASAAGTARYQRSALLDALGQDHVRTARAKGLTPWRVFVRHGLRNALLPMATLVGLSLPFLVSGSVVVERLFSWPGMGRELVDAVEARDALLVSAIALVATGVVVAGNLLADFAYTLLDPRVRVR